MQKFKYKALKSGNEFVEGEIEASTLREARQKIRELGFLPTKLYFEEDEQEVTTFVKSDVKQVHLSLNEKILFTSDLEVLLSSGIPIIEALVSIESNTHSERIRTICENLKMGILSGMTFAEALKSYYGEVFGNVYTGLVKTGEDSGELDKTLSRMLLLLRKQDAIKGKIISASIYPGVLVVLMLGLLILFSKFIFPVFADVIIANGADIPYMAQILINVCNFTNNFWWLLLIGVGALFAVSVKLFKNSGFKSKWDDFVMKIPVVSDFIRYINLSNFMTLLQISYDAGLPIMSGLELSSETIGNFTIKKQATNALTLVKNGKSLSDAFRTTGVLPDVLMTMITTGEKSGTLGKMFKDTVDVIDKKVDMALEALTRLFEPTIIVIMGGAVLFIAIAFYQMYIGMLGSLF